MIYRISNALVLTKEQKLQEKLRKAEKRRLKQDQRLEKLRQELKEAKQPKEVRTVQITTAELDTYKNNSAELIRLQAEWRDAERAKRIE